MEQPESEPKSIEVGTWVYFKGGPIIPHLVVDEMTAHQWQKSRRFVLVRITPHHTTAIHGIPYKILELWPSNIRTDI